MATLSRSPRGIGACCSFCPTATRALRDEPRVCFSTNVSCCRVQGRELQTPGAIELNPITFVLEEPRAGTQYQSDFGSFGVQSISLQIDSVLETAVQYSRARVSRSARTNVWWRIWKLSSERGARCRDSKIRRYA